MMKYIGIIFFLFLATSSLALEKLRQSTATTITLGQFVDDTDFKTAEVALTLSQGDVQLIKNGSTAAQKNDANNAVHRYGGHYNIPLNATDTNTTGSLRVIINESGALGVWKDFEVIPASQFDAEMGTGKFTVLLADNAITAAKIAPNSAMLASSYVAPDNASITAIKNKTDPLPAQPAAVGSAMTLTEAYDAAKTAAQPGDGMFSNNERGTDGALLAGVYTAPLDAAGTRSALGLALANLDTQLAAPLLLLGTPQSQLGTIAGDIAGVKNVAEEASVAAANAETASELLTARNIRLEMDTSSTQFIAIRNKVDNIPAQPAAIGSAMTLTAAYDASKTAAQASDVLAIKVVTDLLYTLLEEADGVWRFTANTLSQGPSGLVLGGDATLANQQKMIEILESGR